MRNNFLVEWTVANPSPICPELEKVPRWSPGLSKQDITPEMRAYRERIVTNNKLISKNHLEAYTEWEKKREETASLYFESLSISGFSKEQEREALYCGYSFCDWRIDELTVI